MKDFKKRLMRRLNNSEHGQSILLLAIGFIALAAFVGLVTDISIMFVRFATLRRAVDAAAVAAAGQIREGTDYASVALAARQYIVLHGLEPHRVWVETCETDIAEWRKTHPEPSPKPAGYSISDEMPETELCDWDKPRKLVRVVAQIDSETTFLRLIGINNFVITSSSISETAALDVVLVLDTSASMAQNTKESDFTDPSIGLTVGYAGKPPTFDNVMPGYCSYAQNVSSGAENYGWGGCCNDPGASAYVHQKTDGTWEIYTDGTVDIGSIPSPMIAIHTNGGHYARLAIEDPGLYNSQSYSVSGANGKYDAGEAGVKYAIPDGNFSDLICQPFRQVKDAARNFIKRLDFIRGDRVALVGFNRLANVYYPNGDSSNPPMMVSQADAIRTLDTYVGIYINPVGQMNGCHATNMARNDVFLRAAGLEPDGDLAEDPLTRDYDGPGDKALRWNVPPESYAQYAQCQSTNIGDGIKVANEVMTNEDTIRRDAVWVAIVLSDGATNASLNIAPDKAAETAGDTESGPLENSTVLYGDFGFCPWYTFCWYRTSGESMWDNVYWRDHPGNNVDYPTDVDMIDVQEVYRNWAGGLWTNLPTNQQPTLAYNLNRDIPLPRAFKQFPSYNDKCLTSIARLGGTAAYDGKVAFCNDNIPDTRHFCLQWSNNESFNGIPEGMTYDPVTRKISGTLLGECAEDGLYDADDYARDMADFAGLIEVAPGVPGNFIAMFAIGFGEDFADEDTAAPLMRYIADAGDNGRIDNTLQQDWRDNKAQDGGSFVGEDPCEEPEFDPSVKANRTKWCGQYYYADNIEDLDAVFEAIAGRLFTRISR